MRLMLFVAIAAVLSGCGVKMRRGQPSGLVPALPVEPCSGCGRIPPPRPPPQRRSP